ncbi:MAG: hypothetical protein EOM67_07100 [Spirochaetia bacterium]|nr:hypothetical protein [Spirochaetia bacterium]
MKRKKNVLALVFLLLCMSILSARSLFDVGLQVVTLYDVDSGIEESSFFEGMSEGANWNFGFGMDVRISILHASVLAASVSGDNNLMNIYYSLLLDIPIINDVIYLSLGGGLSTQLDLPDEPGEKMRYNNRDEGVPFFEVIKDSPIHLKAGVDIILGPATLSLFYLRETSGNIGDSIEQIFTSSGVNKGGVALTLSLF